MEKHPIPKSYSVRGRRAKYPWASMRVGDSFAVALGQITNIRNCAKGWSDRHPGKARFIVARTDYGGDYRCWRVE